MFVVVMTCSSQDVDGDDVAIEVEHGLRNDGANVFLPLDSNIRRMMSIGVRLGVSKGVEDGCRLQALRVGHPQGIEG
jgi:hypothetical protein